MTLAINIGFIHIKTEEWRVLSDHGKIMHSLNWDIQRNINSEIHWLALTYLHHAPTIVWLFRNDVLEWRNGELS